MKYIYEIKIQMIYHEIKFWNNKKINWFGKLVLRSMGLKLIQTKHTFNNNTEGAKTINIGLKEREEK